MDNRHSHRGLDEMWPRIDAEIGLARRRRKKVRRAVAAISVVAAVGMVTLVSTRHAQRATRSPAEALAKAGHPPTSWNLSHVVQTPDASDQYPLVHDEWVFALRADGQRRRVVCVGKRSGNVKWQSSMVFAECRLACDAERLYLLFRNNAAWQCVALDAHTGHVAWRRHAEEADGVSPSMLSVVPGGIVWASGNRLTFCGSGNGETVWEQMTDEDEALTVARVHSRVVCTASIQAVHAFHAGTGSKAWTHAMPKQHAWASVPPLLRLDSERVYITSQTQAGGKGILCLNLKTGDPVWRVAHSAPLRLQVADGHVFVRSTALSALDAKNGTPVWRVALGGCGPISLAGRRLYAMDAADRRELVALDSKSGKTAWRREATPSCSGVVADGNTAFLSGNDSVLHAMALN